jgi:hypothetical protein
MIKFCRYTSVEIKVKTHISPLSEADFVTILNQWNELSVHHVLSMSFDQMVSIPFPKSDAGPGATIMEKLFYFEYRYFRYHYNYIIYLFMIRFLLNPLTGMFEPNYAWVDASWKSLESVLKQSSDGISFPKFFTASIL